MIQILDMQVEHVDSVVNVHMKSFPNFFLTFLGSRFLKLLYDEILNTPDHVSLVAVKRDQVIGFVAGVTQESGLYRRLIRYRLLPFALASINALLRRPTILPRLLRALTYSNRSQESDAQAVLMSIAVSPDAMGTGIGQQLVHGFLDRMLKQGITSVSLTTDSVNNDRANRFYQQLGFQLINTYTTPEKREMNEYIIKLDNDVHV